MPWVSSLLKSRARQAYTPWQGKIKVRYWQRLGTRTRWAPVSRVASQVTIGSVTKNLASVGHLPQLVAGRSKSRAKLRSRPKTSTQIKFTSNIHGLTYFMASFFQIMHCPARFHIVEKYSELGWWRACREFCCIHLYSHVRNEEKQ